MSENIVPGLEKPAIVPVLVLKSTVLFPLQVVSVQINLKANLRLLSDYPHSDDIIAAGVFLDPDAPYSVKNLSQAAVACRVLNRIALGGSRVQIALQGLHRLRLSKITGSRPYFKALADYPIERDNRRVVGDSVLTHLATLVETLIELDERYPEELLHVIQSNAEDPSRCADLITEMLQLGYSERRQLLEAASVSDRLTLLEGLLRREIHRASIAGEVLTKTGVALERREREKFLREQLEITRLELAELDPLEEEITRLIGKVAAAPLPLPVAGELRREIELLRQGTLERSAIRSHIDWVLSIPWQATAKETFKLRLARQLLNKRYFGQETAKTRLLEFVAVRRFGGTTLPLLAIVGPPGTGKTSLAGTLADLLNRPLVRIPMGGIHDASQIRGLQRSEAAAQPGRILDGLREAGVRNPVILIDDVHRLNPDLTPSILAALDPVLNTHFMDHYLGVPFDLSPVLFVITANLEEEIPEPLWECVDVITLSGYSNPVKLEIARKYVWPRVVEQHGLAGRNLRMTSAALRKLIADYTRDAGVRELTLRLDQVCRRAALQLAMSGARRLSVGQNDLEKYLDKPAPIDSALGGEPRIGAVTGLAWTDTGGDLLPVEAILMPGEGNVTLTGLLGEVLRESAQAALSYVRSHAGELDIPAEVLKEKDLHVHFPEGAIPKDGPSAGIAVAAAIASVLSGRPVRSDIAMTGEISLRGRVLAVGGIHEKVLAAYRVGIRHVILPAANESDIAQLPREVRRKLRFHMVNKVADVFGVALGRKPGSSSS